jgi:hypothetical protein
MCLEQQSNSLVEERGFIHMKSSCNRLLPWYAPDAEGGFTSVGVVVALTLVVTLMFTSAQVYWMNSRAGGIQFAADAGVLAAENVVAEFYVVARVVDAVLLSMTLLGMTVLGIAVVVSLIPGGQEVAVKLFEFAQKVFRARDKLADQAIPVLSKLQKLLPFVAIANAAVTTQANAPAASIYVGVAMLVPFTGEEIMIEDDGDMQSAGEDVEEQSQQASEAVQAAEEADGRRQAAFEAGWLADCGNSGVSSSQYERAKKLAMLDSTPYYDLDNWCFEFAIGRARAYYRARLANDTPASSKPDAITLSIMRKIFYQCALDLLEGAYALDDGQGDVHINMPNLPTTPELFRGTSAYRNARFPLDSTGILHGHRGCPVYIENGDAGQGSLSELTSGECASCATCGMEWSSVSKFFDITAKRPSGFEYWYIQVAKAAREYQAASNDYAREMQQAEQDASDAADAYQDAAKMVKAKRIDLHPPGRKGCVIFVFAPAQVALPSGIQSSLIATSTTTVIPTRVAISAAALAKDTNDDANILGSFLKRAEADAQSTASRMALGGFDFVLELWGYALNFYKYGVNGLTDGLRSAAAETSSSTLTKLAAWVADQVEDALESLEIEPVDLCAPKPLLVNSYHVALADSGVMGQALLGAKNGYAYLGGYGSGSLTDMVFDGVLIEAETAINDLVENGYTITIITFGEPLLTVEIPITVHLPQQVGEVTIDFLRDKLREIQSHFKGDSYVPIWE